MGMLPEAVSNYLLRLGWGYGDEEIISRNRAVELFDLDGVGRSPSRFDLKKLENLNGHYIREASNDRLAELVAPRLDREITDEESALLARAMDGLKPRAKHLDEIAEGAAFLFRDVPLDMADWVGGFVTGPAPDLVRQER